MFYRQSLRGLQEACDRLSQEDLNFIVSELDWNMEAAVEYMLPDFEELCSEEFQRPPSHHRRYRRRAMSTLK